MHRTTLAILVLSLFVQSCLKHTSEPNELSEREKYEAYLKQHPFYQNQQINWDEVAKMDRPDLAWQQDFLLTMNPTLKRPTPERLIDLMEQQDGSFRPVPGDDESPWVELGPTNVGGRTRAILFDPADSAGKKVWAGGVTGGLWYINDITNPDSTWRNVGDMWDNIAISAIAADPTNDQVMYVGTGEGWRQGISGAPGAGIWKTEDGGKSWSQLSATADFFYINDLAVRDENGTGVLYVGVDYSSQRFLNIAGSATVGLYRSIDGGQSFNRETLPNNISFRVGDIEIAANNRLWIGTYGNDGQILYSDNGTDWMESTRYAGCRRVELATAPSDSNVLYGILEKGGNCEFLVRSLDGGTTWTELEEPVDQLHSNQDWCRNQAWYDLIAKVDPNDPSTVYVGSIDLFQSTDTGNTWVQISQWYGPGRAGLPYAHADQHQMAFRPSVNGLSSDEILVGNDGGLFLGKDLLDNANLDFTHSVNNYNTVQFYAAAIHPEEGSSYYLAGSQDNGTQQFSSDLMGPTLRATGGDGGYCFIDKDNPDVQFTAYTYNSYWRSLNGGISFGNFIHRDNDRTGWFINPAELDHRQNILFASHSDTALFRLMDTEGTAYDSLLLVDLGSKATNIHVSEYDTIHSTLFVGTGAGRLFKLLYAETDTASAIEIGSASFPNGAISCVDLGANENEILVSFHNYGVTSIWYSDDGGENWVNKEGNLPDLPVRWCRFNPVDRSNVLLATELGIWSTSNFNSANTSWAVSNNGMTNVRVDQLQIRESDYRIIAATHGRGLFYSDGLLFSAPEITRQPDNINLCVGEDARFNLRAGGKQPMTYTWYFNGELLQSSNSPILEVLEVSPDDEGEYHCRITNSDGEETSDTVRLDLKPIPTPDLGPDLTIRPEVTLVLNPGDGYRTYIWSTGWVQQELKIKGEDLGIGTHEISCKVYNDDLCMTEEFIQITVDELAGMEGIESTEVEVYPNPATDKVFIQSNRQGVWKLYDQNGREVQRLNRGWNDICNLPKGLYFVRNGDEKGETVRLEKL